MSEKFKVHGICCFDKEIEITGPFELRLLIDYDDVNHPRVDRDARKLVALLNAHWATFRKKPKAKKRKPLTADQLADSHSESFENEQRERERFKSTMEDKGFSGLI